MSPFQSKLLQFELTFDELASMEEHALYESGLLSDGCFNNLDDYAKQSIARYGKILLKSQKERIYNMDEVVCSCDINE
jgi:uncharacterized protein YccT (UPF0319 family)